MVKIQEAEAQIVTHYEVYGERPWDSDLLLPALNVHHQLRVARRIWSPPTPRSSPSATSLAHSPRRQRVAIPNRTTKSTERKRLEKKRWFRNAQRWRTGCEGRISLLKRRHGLNRCRYKG